MITAPENCKNVELMDDVPDSSLLYSFFINSEKNEERVNSMG